MRRLTRTSNRLLCVIFTTAIRNMAAVIEIATADGLTYSCHPDLMTAGLPPDTRRLSAIDPAAAMSRVPMMIRMLAHC